MKPVRSIAALCAAFFVVIGLVACGGGIPGDAVVQIDGTPISTATFNHWIAVAASSSAGAPGAKPVIPDPPNYTACIAHLEATQPKPAKGVAKPTPAALKAQCAQEFKALKEQVLGFLISTRWIFGEAEDQGIKVSDAEVKAKLNEIKKKQFPKEAEFQKFIASSGQTISDILLRVKLQMLSKKIQEKITKGAAKKVTEAEISKYYNENKQRFGQPESRDLEIILTKAKQQAEKAMQEIHSGKSFAEVAKKASIDPSTKALGGALPGVVRGQEEKALDTAAFTAKVGVLSGPIQTPFGYYVFQVKAIHPGKQQSLAEVKEQIKQLLTSQGEQAALTAFVKKFQTKWKERTECRSEYTVEDCKGFKKPTPTTTTGTSTKK
ncbi:MAG TPA: peptidyl-prolyl cis-trans isomerase [Solirubrobacteraceae bacterium]|nr:peptidyl-prolyl cis-trans isomerase [Solirubrobacteraceae bacterium]